MEECSKCGITRNKAKLYEAISDEGIVTVCRRCAEEDDLMIIRRPVIRNIPDKEVSFKESIQNFEKRKALQKRMPVENVSLKDIVEKNFQRRFNEKPHKHVDLVDNFHWFIMRARRMKKLSHDQIAKDIGESALAVKMAEKGLLPEDNFKLVNKLEAYLNIRIRKEIPKESPQEVIRDAALENSEDGIDFDPMTTKSLRISDLKRMKKSGKTNEEMFNGMKVSLGEKKKSEDDLSDEDMNKLIFGGK